MLVAFLVVGPKDLPKVARALARLVKYLRTVFQEFKDETGLDETLEELKGVETDLKETLREADPRQELRSAKMDLDKAVRQSKELTQAKAKDQ